MRTTLLAFCLLSTVLLVNIKLSQSECCKVPIKCEVSGKTTYKCYDCTESTVYCGKGKCNILGCNCDGGCRQGDSTMSCWNIASGCKLRGYYSASGDNDFFTALDTDSDGKVSYTEAKHYIKEFRPTDVDIEYELRQLDSNGDGFLQFSEMDGY